MKVTPSRNAIYAIGFVLFILVLGYLELTYTRRVDGTSMLPTLEEGDLVAVQAVPFSQLKIGDIIVYNPPCSGTGTSVIHRIVGNTSNGFITKGDNNPVTDQESLPRIAVSPITPNCYVGKVVFAVPYLERLASLPYGANYLLVLLIIIALVYFWLGDRPEDKKKGPGAGQQLPEDGKEPESRGFGQKNRVGTDASALYIPFIY